MNKTDNYPKISIKTLPLNLEFWKFKEMVKELEGCLREKSYYSQKYGHYINYQKHIDLLKEVKDE